MTQKERVEKFLEELTKLTEEYQLIVTAEGTSPLLYDFEKKEYATEFGAGFFSATYKAYDL